MTKNKILLFGGTAESTEISRKILSSGFSLTLSTASDDSKLITGDLDITRKTGKMNVAEISDYIRENKFSAVICAVHPYAADARANIISACKSTNTPCHIFLRPDSVLSDLPDSLDIHFARDHYEAADIANSLPGNILLTTGSRNLHPYMENISGSTHRVFARVLNCTESETALHDAGVLPSHSVLARGPFSVSDNLKIIRDFNISTLITKDGGKSGGTPEKLEAATATSCSIILISRPTITEPYYSDIDELLSKI